MNQAADILKKPRHEPPAQPRLHHVAGDCETCRNLGMVWIVDPHDKRIGKSIECPACHNAKNIAEKHARDLARIAQNWRLPPNVAKLADEPLVALATMSPETKKIYAQAMKTINAFTTKWPRGIIVTFDGNYGTAKTHILSIMNKRCVAANKIAILASAATLEKMLTDFGHARGFGLTPDEAYRDLRCVDVLLLDEADRYTHRTQRTITHPDTAEQIEGYFERDLFTLIDELLNAGKSIVMAGNHIAKAMHKGIISRARAADCVWCDMTSISDARPDFARNAPGWL